MTFAMAAGYDRVVATLAELQGLSNGEGGLSHGDRIYVKCRATPGDGYAGAFEYRTDIDAALPTADTQGGVYVAEPNGVGAFVRIEFQETGVYNVRWAGAVGDATVRTAAITGWEESGSFVRISIADTTGWEDGDIIVDGSDVSDLAGMADTQSYDGVYDATVVSATKLRFGISEIPDFRGASTTFDEAVTEGNEGVVLQWVATDNHAAFKSAFDTIAALQGGAVAVPRGRFWIDTDAGAITIPEACEFRGLVSNYSQRKVTAASGGELLNQGTEIWISGTTNSPFEMEGGATVRDLIFRHRQATNTHDPVEFPWIFGASATAARCLYEKIVTMNADKVFQDAGASTISGFRGQVFRRFAEVNESQGFCTIADFQISSLFAPGNTGSSDTWAQDNLEVIRVVGSSDGITIRDFSVFRANLFFNHVGESDEVEKLNFATIKNGKIDGGDRFLRLQGDATAFDTWCAELNVQNVYVRADNVARAAADTEPNTEFVIDCAYTKASTADTGRTILLQDVRIERSNFRLIRVASDSLDHLIIKDCMFIGVATQFDATAAPCIDIDTTARVEITGNTFQRLADWNAAGLTGATAIMPAGQIDGGAALVALHGNRFFGFSSFTVQNCVDVDATDNIAADRADTLPGVAMGTGGDVNTGTENLSNNNDY